MTHLIVVKKSQIFESFAFFRQQQNRRQESTDFSDLVLRYIDPDYSNISQP